MKKLCPHMDTNECPYNAKSGVINFIPPSPPPCHHHAYAPPHHHLHAPPPPPHHNYHGELPPHIRSSLVRIIVDESEQRLKDTFGNSLPQVISVITTAPAEIKLTLAMLLELRVDLSLCDQYMVSPIFESRLLNEEACRAISDALGEENLSRALWVYKTCPAEQTLIATTVASLIKKKVMS